jgi:HEAT repeat protein
MIQRLLNALVESDNESADDVLLEVLRLGSEPEKASALDALIRRGTVGGLGGVVALFDQLPQSIQFDILAQIRHFHSALREAGRSSDLSLRQAALRLIARARQGKLAYVISENLSHPDEALSRTAAEALVALARWIATETRALQRLHVSALPAGSLRQAGPVRSSAGKDKYAPEPIPGAASVWESYPILMENRPEIEAAVARAMDIHRGRNGQELLRAALLLCDWPGSKTLAILHTTKHGGQSPMVRRMQQPPASEHVEAFLLGASHGQLRSHFGPVFGNIDEAPVLDALLRRTHWLKDHQLQICMHHVQRGVWFGEAELLRDLERRPPEDAARVAEWIAASALNDAQQDARLDRIREHCRSDFGSRLRLLRIAAGRKRGTGVMLLRELLRDSDERIVRMAAREIIRRRPGDFENLLLNLMTGAGESVRRVVGRAIGHISFDHFWNRFDRMEKSTRKQAGRAMLKLLPDALQRLQRRLASGPIDGRVRAIQIVQELELAEVLRGAIIPLCSHPNAKVRSKAVIALGQTASGPPDILMEKVLHDTDARVRANAIEILEARKPGEFVPLLTERARSSHSRERANAIKALSRLRVSTAANALMSMLRDPSPDHRVSAMWALRQIGWWKLINEVGKIAKSDENLRVRRYALGVLRNVAELVQAKKQAG